MAVKICEVFVYVVPKQRHVEAGTFLCAFKSEPIIAFHFTNGDVASSVNSK